MGLLPVLSRLWPNEVEAHKSEIRDLTLQTVALLR
jgi:hypothetical protein